MAQATISNPRGNTLVDEEGIKLVSLKPEGNIYPFVVEGEPTAKGLRLFLIEMQTFFGADGLDPDKGIMLYLKPGQYQRYKSVGLKVTEAFVDTLNTLVDRLANAYGRITILPGGIENERLIRNKANCYLAES